MHDFFKTTSVTEKRATENCSQPNSIEIQISKQWIFNFPLVVVAFRCTQKPDLNRYFALRAFLGSNNNSEYTAAYFFYIGVESHTGFSFLFLSLSL